MPTVSAIIAARNEESNIGAAVLSLEAQPEIDEIFVVDDQSTDGTARVLADLAGQVSRLRVFQAGELPAGWVGKNHALWLGAARANGEWLLFTDADVRHLPGSTGCALNDATRLGAAIVSYSPEQEMQTWWERAVIPFVFTRLSRVYPFEEASNPVSPIAAANGQFLMIRREAYAAIGGHSAVRADVLEDVALARRAKQGGYRLHFAPGGGIARTRMYATFGAMWQGWTKNLSRLLGGRDALGPEFAWGFGWLLPIFAVALLPASIGIWAALALAVFLHLIYGYQLWRIAWPVSSVLYYLPGAVLYSGLLIASTWQYRRGRVIWKGREYPVESR